MSLGGRLSTGALASEPEAGPDIFQLQIRELFHDLLRGEPIGEQIEDVADPDPHPADAWPSAALAWLDSNAFEKLHAPKMAGKRHESKGGSPLSGTGKLSQAHSVHEPWRHGIVVTARTVCS